MTRIQAVLALGAIVLVAASSFDAARPVMQDRSGTASVAAPATRGAACVPTTVLLVRHAERDGKNDALTAETGPARARALVHVASKAGITAVIHTNTARTEATAAPLASALGLIPVVLPAADVAGVVATIRAQHKGKTVLVVGHSNTVPRVIEALGGPTLPDIPDDEFDNLFVVEGFETGPARVTNLQYGAASP